jgi:Desulfoferrodoxin, N-terminal domain
MSVSLGKRYVCQECGMHALCTKAGDGELICCGAPMEMENPKALPQAD